MTDNTKHNPTNNHPDESKRLAAHMRQQSEEQFRRQMREATRLLTEGRGQAAIPLLERCQDIHPEDVNVLTNLGGAYILAAQFEDAVPVLEQASELSPQNPAIWMNLAAAYLGKMYTATRERQDKALAAYQRALAIEPHYPNVHYNMGLIYIDRKDWDDAAAAFEQALASNPHDQDARRMLNRVELVRSAPDDPQLN